MIAAAELIVAISSQQSAVSEPKRDLLGNQEPLQNA